LIARLRHNRRQVLGLAGGMCACSLCGANAATLTYDLVAEEIAPRTWGVFGASEYFNLSNGANIVNIAFIEAPDGVVVIDSGPSRRYGEALLELIGATVPGKRVIRVFNTHHHPDHFLGNQVFDPALLAAPQKVIDNIAAEGEALADNMYRLVGDWMRGTAPVAPQLVIAGSGEDIGGRHFTYLLLDGHTSADFALRDDETGMLFAGDLAFLHRAPTTPHADIARWRDSLASLSNLDRDAILPGHGPLDPSGASIAQTLDYLDWLDGTLRDAVARGLTMNEAMALEIPARFLALDVVRTEYERSVVHLYPAYEQVELPAVEVSR
jgi:uncharacterized sulfatase